MKILRVLMVGAVCAFALNGCVGDSSNSADASPGGSSRVMTMPGNADSPPVTVSGYVDTSATTQVK